ncbi:hypothetical protein F5Y19DRAFT_231392 [Xylariaceae sp. FL1651]|nr:hypothetical protein F5Y19DRAFT_231392 [Xylariaceae sp. FL1651]
MQTLSHQDHVDRRHGIHSFVPQSISDLPFHSSDAADNASWSAQENIWHLNSFAIEHPAIENFDFSAEHQLMNKANNVNHHPAVSIDLSSEDWHSHLALDTAWDKYENFDIASVPSLYPLTPQDSLETLPPNGEIEKCKRPSSPVSPVSPDEGPATQKKRIRNRLAAVKCRKKAKRGLDELQQRERDLLRENKLLNAQACALRNEVIELKTEILRHSKCDNEVIQKYISHTAEQIGGAYDGHKARSLSATSISS